MAFETTEAGSLEVVQQTFGDRGVLGGEGNVHLGAKFGVDGVCESWRGLVEEVVKDGSPVLSKLLVVVDASHFEHVLTHELRDINRHHGRSVGEEILGLLYFEPVHHQRWDFLAPPLLNLLHDVISDNGEGQSRRPEVLLSSSVNDSIIAPNILQRQRTNGRAHIANDDDLRALSFDSIYNGTLSFLIETDAIN